MLWLFADKLGGIHPEGLGQLAAYDGETPQRERYAHMGALLVALEAANAEVDSYKPA